MALCARCKIPMRLGQLQSEDAHFHVGWREPQLCIAAETKRSRPVVYRPCKHCVARQRTWPTSRKSSRKSAGLARQWCSKVCWFPWCAASSRHVKPSRPNADCRKTVLQEERMALYGRLYLTQGNTLRSCLATRAQFTAFVERRPNSWGNDLSTCRKCSSTVQQPSEQWKRHQTILNNSWDNSHYFQTIVKQLQTIKNNCWNKCEQLKTIVETIANN